MCMGEHDVYRELIAHFQNSPSPGTITTALRSLVCTGPLSGSIFACSDTLLPKRLDTQLKCKKTLKALLANCADLRSLEPLLEDAPPKVQKCVLNVWSLVGSAFSWQLSQY